MFIRFDTIHERDGQIHKRTDTGWRLRPRLIARQKSRLSTNISLYLLNCEVRAIVTMEGEYETVQKLSNGAISNDFEWPQT